VLIQGIPPKWVDWQTMNQVASSLGRMIQIDWQTLFFCFFCSVRVKLQCKDPSKIPKERLFVFKNKIHLVMFTAEGYEQEDNTSDGGSDKGDDNSKKDDKPLEEQLSDDDKGSSKGKGEEDAEKEQNGSISKNLGSKSASVGGRNVKRVLQFDAMEKQQLKESMECAKLLNAMELDDEQDMADEGDINLNLEIQQDEELCQLPEEWIFDLGRDQTESLSSKMHEEARRDGMNISLEERNGDSKLAENILIPSDTEEEQNYDMDTSQKDQAWQGKLAKGKKKMTSKQWGPVIATRRSARNLDNGKTMMEKAQEAKRKWNLDTKTGMPKTNISKSLLISVAKETGLVIKEILIS